MSIENNNISIENSLKRSLVSRILLELANQFSQFGHQEFKLVIDQNAWKNLMGTFHYLGNAAETSDSSGFPSDPNIKNFIISPSNGQGYYKAGAYFGYSDREDVSIPNPSLADFIPNTIKCLKDFRRTHGDDALIVTFKELRDYLTQYHPKVSLILQNIGIGNIESGVLQVRTNYKGDFPFYDPSKNKNVLDLAAYVIGRFFAGEGKWHISDLQCVGIIPDIFHDDINNDSLEVADEAILNLHFPSEDFKE